ncbi:MAG: GTPase HflX [Bacteroidales bacterium]|nr:GTPase HflX [Bacteroidales bacterium]
MEKAVLINVITPDNTEFQANEYLDELEFLAMTASIEAVARFSQRVDRPNSATYVGKGKLQEIKEYIANNEIHLAIFDDELTGAQVRNLEKELNCSILDRTSLILDIFALRAQTAYAKTQVELARYQYILPRLTGMWSHLERQRGGRGTRGGSGEKQLETDRRIVMDKISQLKEQLKKIDRQMATQRGNRGGLVRVSLVGYTNVGKSTIMNLLSKSNVFAENKLFATLDTTVRKVVIENTPFLLSDTVGFIRKLPHQLVESFKSTLDEVREADILLHVVDVSHPNFEDQIKVVKHTLDEIGASNKPVFMVFNKIDAYKYTPKSEFDFSEDRPGKISLRQLEESWVAKENSPAIFISALKKIGIDKLRNDLYKMVGETIRGRYPFTGFLWQNFDEDLTRDL